MRSLQLNGNGFKSVPACLAELKIKELFLGNNRQGQQVGTLKHFLVPTSSAAWRLSALPSELGRMRLKKLALGSNRFHSFPTLRLHKISVFFLGSYSHWQTLVIQRN